jgi:pimeloyl-ACP methyl ester carboxylesterase
MNVAATAHARDLEVGGHAWRERGDGGLVVLLHGLGGSRIAWDAQLASLGSRWRVAAWDMPGYGAAAPLPDQPLTFRALADAADAWIVAMGATSAHVVGISMGGMIAQYLAAWHPQRVRSLTLLSSSPKFGMDGTTADDWRAARLAPLDAGWEPAEFAERVLRGIVGPNITAAAYGSQREAMERVPGVALRQSIECLVTHDTTALLPTITAPTLVLVGELDQETPPAYSQYLVDHLPDARLVVVPGAGHLLNAEAPEQVNRLLAEHLTAVEAS